ncbi:MAG: DNRLRE domain-containing protein [Caldilineaceae bacterium]
MPISRIPLFFATVLSILLLYCLCATGVANAQVATATPTISTSIISVTVSADTYVQNNAATTNYGTANQLRVRSSGPTNNSYLRFVVSGVTGVVQSAKIRLYVVDASPSAGSVYTASNNYLSTTTPWVETGMNWNNAPTIGGAALSTVAAANLNTWVEFDVTTLVKGNGTYNLAIRNNSTNPVYYNSKEATSNRPTLVLQVVNGATATATNTSTNTPTNTPTSTPTFTPVPTNTATATPSANSAAFTITVNADTYVDSTATTTNYGTANQLRVRSSRPTNDSYLRFVVTGLTGSVQSAKVRLYVVDASPSAGSIYSVSNNYLNTATPWLETGMNWSNAPAINSAALSTIGAANLNTWVVFDVSAAVKGNGTFNFAIRNTSTNPVYYSSKEATNNRPVLVLQVTNSGTATATSSPTSTPTSTSTSTSVPTSTPTNTATNTSVPPTNTATNTPVPPTSTATDTPTNTPLPTNTATNTYTSTPTPTDTSTQTVVPATSTPLPPTSTATDTPTNTPLPTNTATNTYTSTPTPTDTSTQTVVPATDTATSTPLSTNTSTETVVPPTDTATDTPVSTNTSTETVVPATDTATVTPSPTDTATVTSVPSTATDTPVPPTNTGTDTPLPATSTSTATTVPPTATETSTLIPTNTGTETAVPFTDTPTSTSTPVNTATDTVAPTEIATNTPIPTSTATETATATPTSTSTSTLLPTNTATNTATNTPAATATSTLTPTSTAVALKTPYASAPLCPTHDPTIWHGLWNPVLGCHYDHFHGVDPNSMANYVISGTTITYGPAGALYGGQTIGYSFETPNENAIKHRGYHIQAAIQVPCEQNNFNYINNPKPGCIRSFRVQVHNDTALVEGVTRFHSMFTEAELCTRAGVCGLWQGGGARNDTGEAHIPYKNTCVDIPGSNRPPCPTDPAEWSYIMNIPPYWAFTRLEDARWNLDNEYLCFDGMPYCWNQSSNRSVWELVSSDSPIASRYGEANFLVGMNWRTHAASAAYNSTTGMFEYVCPNSDCVAIGDGVFLYTLIIRVPSFLDLDGNGLIESYNGYTDPAGRVDTVNRCLAPSADCVPLRIQNVAVGTYIYDMTAPFLPDVREWADGVVTDGVRRFDITPADYRCPNDPSKRCSWVTLPQNLQMHQH